MKWQPIETAPKDGTEVLLYWPLYDCEGLELCAVYAGYYQSFRNCDVFDCQEDDPEAKDVIGGFWHFSSATLDDRYVSRFDPASWRQEAGEMPTHWMPLPSVDD